MGIVALLYSSVGLAGGSSYIALLTIFGVEYLYIPTISLSLNIVVSTLGIFNFFRSRHGSLSLAWPFLVSSIPLAWVGGTIHLSALKFNQLLALFLLIVAVRIYLFPRLALIRRIEPPWSIPLSLLIGASLGFISGALGLGGGIYLIPLIVLFGLGSQKEAAACGALFIWVNSLAGLGARLASHPLPPLYLMGPMLVAVAIGGYSGSFIGANRISPRTMQRILGVIIIIAIGFLILKSF